MRTIRVTEVSFDGSIATAVGTDVQTGERLAFYGDHRMMRDVAHAIDAARTESELPECAVESWQIAGR